MEISFWLVGEYRFVIEEIQKLRFQLDSYVLDILDNEKFELEKWSLEQKFVEVEGEKKKVLDCIFDLEELFKVVIVRKDELDEEFVIMEEIMDREV